MKRERNSETHCRDPVGESPWRFGGWERNFNGELVLGQKVFISIVGLDEKMVRACIRKREELDER
jgi:hypothetical protein